MNKLAINSLVAFLLILITVSSQIQANTTPLLSTAYNNATVRREFLKILESPDNNVLSISFEEVYVHFTVNTMNEIVILTTETNNSKLDAFLKRTMNFERIDVKNIILDADYNIKLTF